MGKGLIILFFLIMLPLTILLSIVWGVSYWKWKTHAAGKLLLFCWATVVVLVGFIIVTEPYFQPAILTNDDIYGEYRIDKS